jgi:hypothetical protein
LFVCEVFTALTYAVVAYEELIIGTAAINEEIVYPESFNHRAEVPFQTVIFPFCDAERALNTVFVEGVLECESTYDFVAASLEATGVLTLERLNAPAFKMPNIGLVPFTHRYHASFVDPAGPAVMLGV